MVYGAAACHGSCQTHVQTREELVHAARRTRTGSAGAPELRIHLHLPEDRRARAATRGPEHLDGDGDGVKECTVTLHEPNDTSIRADSIDRSIDRSNLDTAQEEARRTISGSGSGSGVRARLHSALPLASLAHKVPNMRCTYIRWDAACSVPLLGALLEQRTNEQGPGCLSTVQRASGPWPAE